MRVKLIKLFIPLLILVPCVSMAADEKFAVADIFRTDVAALDWQPVEKSNNISLSILLACFIISVFTVTCSARVYHKNYARCSSKLNEVRLQLEQMIPAKIIVHTQQLDQMLDEYEQLAEDIRKLKDALQQRREA